MLQEKKLTPAHNSCVFLDQSSCLKVAFCYFQADLLGSPVVRPSNIETTALGAAYAAGLAVGVWSENYIFSSGEKKERLTTFHPNIGEEIRKKKNDSWCKAITRTFDLADLSL